MIKKHRKITTQNLLILIFFGISVSAAVYLWIKTTQQSKTITQIEAVLEKKDKAIATLDTFEKVDEKNQAQEILNRAQKYRIKWSEIYSEITRLENNEISFLSFSTGRDQKVSVSGVAKNMEAVAQLLETLKSNPRTEDPFIGSLSESEINGRKVYNFPLVFTFKN